MVREDERAYVFFWLGGTVQKVYFYMLASTAPSVSVTIIFRAVYCQREVVLG